MTRLLRAPLLAAMCVGVAASQIDQIRFLRALSGPSGKVNGGTFALDEVRSRFVYPQDKSFVVYFEWDAPPGLHTLTALWKQPDGRIGSISPDVKVQSSSRELRCYWTYTLTSGMMEGVWTLEVRVDGQPTGSHPFEIAGTAPAAPEPQERPQPAVRTVDEIFRAASPSMVWIHKLEADGKRSDTASGFVAGPNRIITAFQAIDSAARLQIEFAGGRIVETDEILAFSRTGDWAALKADTGPCAALELGDAGAVAVGERLIVFNVEGGARTIGGVDISGRRNVPEFGPRIQLTPGLPPETAGGPLLDVQGRVVGILGGSLTPGARIGNRPLSVSPALGISLNGQFAAVPISVLPAQVPETGRRLSDLVSAGALTPPIAAMPEFLYGGTAPSVPKDASAALPQTVSEFSRRDPQVCIFALWQKKGKLSKGAVSASIYDERNRLRGQIAPKKMSLSTVTIRWVAAFAPQPLVPGVYRIDVLWDARPVWRTFIRISE